VSSRTKRAFVIAALAIAGAGLWLAVAGGLIAAPPEQRVIRAFILADATAASRLL